MEEMELLRIVALRRGRLMPSEFKLREGEKGLSLFAHVKAPGAEVVIEAVRTVGKQGILAAAVLPALGMRSLGLCLAHTEGGTLDAGVNAIHYEARLSILRRLFLRLRGIPLHEYYNENLTPKLFSLARLLDLEGSR
jgi:hypothetical protein